MSDKTATFQTYRGLPALAGLANMAAAARTHATARAKEKATRDGDSGRAACRRRP